MAKIVPAILSRSPDEIREKIQLLESIPGLADVQLDFADGRFVESLTALPSDLFGLETQLQIEAHMMVVHPEQYFHDLEMLGVKSLYVHHESFPNSQTLAVAVANAKFMGFRCGIAINPETPLSAIAELMPRIDGVLLLSVHPGLQGQKFLRESLGRLRTLRQKYKTAILEIDGGINLLNFENILVYGADRIVVGSGIWQTPDPKHTVEKLLQKLK